MVEDIHPKVAQKLLQVFLDADLHHQLNGTPYQDFLYRESRKHLGQARRLIVQVAGLGPDAKIWMKHFIDGMNEDTDGPT